MCNASRRQSGVHLIQFARDCANGVGEFSFSAA